jgi:hypothetical protein
MSVLVENTFPIHAWKRNPALPATMPWFLVERWRARAYLNHGQTLEVLAERGGLCSRELWCAAHDKKLRELPSPEVADAWLLGVLHSVRPWVDP